MLWQSGRSASQYNPMSTDFRFKSREWFKGAPHRAVVAAETAKAVRAFDTAAKKVQKAIAAIAAGDDATEKKLFHC